MSQPNPAISCMLGVASTAGGLVVSFSDSIEQWMRIASLFSVVLLNLVLMLRRKAEK